MQNKGVRQANAWSQNSEAIDVWKVALHSPSRHVVVCDDYSLKNTIVFFLLQWEVQTIIEIKTGLKRILERVPSRKNMSKACQNVFSVCIAISQNFRWFKASLERFLRRKYCFSWSNLYWIKSVWLDTVQNWILCYFVAFLINRLGCVFHCNTDILLCSATPSA